MEFRFALFFPGANAAMTIVRCDRMNNLKNIFIRTKREICVWIALPRRADSRRNFDRFVRRVAVTTAIVG